MQAAQPASDAPSVHTWHDVTCARAAPHRARPLPGLTASLHHVPRLPTRFDLLIQPYTLTPAPPKNFSPAFPAPLFNLTPSVSLPSSAMQFNFTPPARQPVAQRPPAKVRKASRTSFKDITGQRFGRWTVIAESTAPRKSQTQWRCRCDCGNTKPAVLYGSLVRGASKSCGCLRTEQLVKPSHTVHSLRNPTYCAWNNMVRRHKPGVCLPWRNNFDQFLADMGPRPAGAKLTSMDGRRWDKENCEWRVKP